MFRYQTSPALFSRVSSVDAHIRIYPDSNTHKAELYIAGTNPQRFRIGLTQHDIEEINKELRQSVEKIAHNYDENGVSDEMLLQLASAGKYAFNRIFADGAPREIVRKLQEIPHLEKMATIEISSENFFIPWELLYCGPLNPQADFSYFWGAQYIVARTLIQDDRPGDMVSPIIETACPRVGLITHNGLTYVAEKEVPALQELNQRKLLSLALLRSLDSMNHSKELEEFSNFLAEELQILHLACHTYIKSPLASSCLRISDYFDITMQDFYAREFRMKCNPFVILNACRTGTISPLYTSNWAALFLRHGARGVLATEFSVPDWFAAVFIPSLYKYFLSGIPIGEALWATRHCFWEEKRNPLGLAYALYSPLAVRIVNTKS